MGAGSVEIDASFVGLLIATQFPRWAGLRRRVMRADLGWDKPARRYAHVYRQAQSR